MFTEKQIKEMHERAAERNKLRHELGPSGFVCPVTNKVTQWVYSSHERLPGHNNLCEHCAPADWIAPSLSELNERRRRESEQGK